MLKLALALAAALSASVAVVGCATEDPFLKNRDAAIAMAKADSGCAEPMNASLANQTDVGLGGNNVRGALVVVQGCGKTLKYQTTCAHTELGGGCDVKPDGAPVSAPAQPPAPTPDAASASSSSSSSAPAPAGKP